MNVRLSYLPAVLFFGLLAIHSSAIGQEFRAQVDGELNREETNTITDPMVVGEKGQSWYEGCESCQNTKIKIKHRITDVKAGFDGMTKLARIPFPVMRDDNQNIEANGVGKAADPGAAGNPLEQSNLDEEFDNAGNKTTLSKEAAKGQVAKTSEVALKVFNDRIKMQSGLKQKFLEMCATALQRYNNNNGAPLCSSAKCKASALDAPEEAKIDGAGKCAFGYQEKAESSAYSGGCDPTKLDFEVKWDAKSKKIYTDCFLNECNPCRCQFSKP